MEPLPTTMGAMRSTHNCGTQGANRNARAKERGTEQSQRVVVKLTMLLGPRTWCASAMVQASGAAAIFCDAVH